MNKKNFLILVIFIALVISSISNFVLILNFPKSPSFNPIPREQTLIVGTSSGPYTLDIVDCWDSASIDILYQIVETLFTNNLRDPDLPRINLLADSYYWENDTTLHIKLREGIIFHDGTPFNNIAAKWNFDRLLYLTNSSGLNYGEVAEPYSLWMRSDRITPIIKEVMINGEFNITIDLNAPYSPLLNLLTHISSGMLSPTAHKDDATRFIKLTTDTLVGTGPFVYEYYTSNIEVVLSRWESYRENVAYFKCLKFKIFDDPEEAKYAMLNGTIDINKMVPWDDLPAYGALENVVVKHYSEDTGIASLYYRYIAFNYDKINVTWRKAVNYAINYSYILDQVGVYKAIKANSPISPAFGLSYNESLVAPDFNITKAREVMISMGYGNKSWSDTQWIAVANSMNPFFTLNYTYWFGDNYNIGMSIKNSCKYIGVSVDLYDTSWEFYTMLCPDCFGTEDGTMRLSAWAPDYLDAYNMLDHFISGLNQYYPPINDPILDSMMELVLETTDETERNELYKNMQWYFSKNEYFHVPLYHTMVFYVHSADLRNLPYNAMGIFQAYGIWRIMVL